MKIAIIGTGISGLGAAYLLHPHHEITVYEKNDRIGGHSRTINIIQGTKTIPVDTGFIVFNRINYPLLTGLFRHLDVPIIESDMSFGASIANGWLEYGSNGIFAQWRNILRPCFWGMLSDILRFNRTAMACSKQCPHSTLGQLLDAMKMGDWFRRYYLLAMGAAIWSCPAKNILEYPAQTFLTFFDNHGLLTVKAHPQWHTIDGGSREYVTRLCASFKGRIRMECGVKIVSRTESGVLITDSKGITEKYDHVVFACHANEALCLLSDSTKAEDQILGAFDYQENHVIVHSDESFMPHRKKSWSSWIYLAEKRTGSENIISLTYWMNRLQSLKTDISVLVTLNPGRRPAEDSIQDEYVFHHPVFTLKTLQAQNDIAALQGQQNTWYCGAYQRYGFHEDGLRSAIAIAEKLGAKIPWT